MFLTQNFSTCLECSKELSRLDGFFELPQHMFWLKNLKIIFLLRKRLDVCVAASRYHSQCMRMTPDAMYRSSFFS